jgi:hypothetical protein
MNRRQLLQAPLGCFAVLQGIGLETLRVPTSPGPVYGSQPIVTYDNRTFINITWDPAYLELPSKLTSV